MCALADAPKRDQPYHMYVWYFCTQPNRTGKSPPRKKKTVLWHARILYLRFILRAQRNGKYLNVYTILFFSGHFFFFLACYCWMTMTTELTGSECVRVCECGLADRLFFYFRCGSGRRSNQQAKQKEKITLNSFICILQLDLCVLKLKHNFNQKERKKCASILKT